MGCYSCLSQQQMIAASVAATRSLAAKAISQPFSSQPFTCLRSFAHCSIGHQSVLIHLRRSKYALLLFTKASFDKTIALICRQIQLSFRQPNVGTSSFISNSAVAIAPTTGSWRSTGADNRGLVLIARSNHQVKLRSIDWLSFKQIRSFCRCEPNEQVLIVL
jgi:hypothetical protein